MTLAARVRLWLREPLVHFLIAGLAVFAVSSWRGSSVDPESRTITITADQVGRLGEAWKQTWQRAPTGPEIDGLIRDHIKEEVYYREAKRLGLDEDDSVIRRRLRSKMEFLAVSEAENAVPDDATLQAMLDRNPAKYGPGSRYSLDQLYLAGGSQREAEALLRTLERNPNWAKLSDRISLPASLEAATGPEIAQIFGNGFAAEIADAPTGAWRGPVMSGFGMHLVRVRKITPAAKPRLADVRQAVENDWRATTLRDREAKAYQALLDGYTIRIAKP